MVRGFKNLKTLLLCAASGMACSTALAQEATVAGDEIIVVGTYKSSLQDALDLKRSSDQIVDAVVAEDIGKFPAANLAEAVQRIPGVAITRERGEGQFISARGLGPIFQSVTFNDMPIAFNENNRDSGQSGRQFRFRVLPADLIAGIEVIKSPSADLIDGGIGSSVNVRTKKPLDSGTFIAGSVFGHYEELAKSVTPNGNLTAGWVNEADTFGAILGYSRSEREIQFDRVQIERYDTDFDGVPGLLTPNSFRLTEEQENRVRNSVSGVVQWRPTDRFEFNADVLWSVFDNDIREDRIILETNDPSEQVPGARVVDPDSNVVISNRFTGGRISRNTELSGQAHENLSFRASLEYEAAEGLIIVPSFAYSEAESNLDLPLQRIDGRTTTGVDYSYDLGTDPLGSDQVANVFVDLDLSQPGAVPFRRYRIRPIDSKDEDATFRLDITKEVNDSPFLTKVKIGGQYTDRSRVYERRDRTLTAQIDPLANFSTFNTVLTPSNAFGDIVGNGPIQWAGYSEDIIGQFQLNPADLPLSERTDGDLRNSYAVGEEILAAYVRTDYATEIQGVPVTGNVGVRYVETEQTIDGSVNQAVTDPTSLAVTVVTTPATFTDSYSEWLPSANAVFLFTDNVQLRLAASRSIARPSLADLRSAQALNSTAVSDLEEHGSAALPDLQMNGLLIGQGGNPFLDPYSSWNYDASLEWYFDGFGAFTLAAFHKDISNFIQRSVENEAFTVNGVTTDFAISRPRNVGTANITGIEIAYSNAWDFDFATIGISGSATFTDSSVTNNVPGNEGLQTPADVSDITYFIAPFIEKGPMQARASYTFRSAYLRNPAFAGGRAFIQDDFATLDLSVSYNVNENFTLFADGVNMLDNTENVFRSPGFFVPSNSLVPLEINDFGRSMNFGVRAKF